MPAGLRPSVLIALIASTLLTLLECRIYRGIHDLSITTADTSTFLKVVEVALFRTDASKRRQARVSFSRNSRIVFSSGVGAPRSKPRNRSQLNRSRIRNSIRCVTSPYSALPGSAPLTSQRDRRAVDRPSHHHHTPAPFPAPDGMPRSRDATHCLQRIAAIRQSLQLIR